MQAIFDGGNLEKTYDRLIERDTAKLIDQMQKAIDEANTFIDSMQN